MGKTAVGLYETPQQAQQVVRELVQDGFSRSDIRLMLGDSSSRQLREWYEDEPSLADGSRSQWADGGATSMLQSLGVPRNDAQNYEEALHRGHALVSVATTDQRIDNAVDVMSRHDIIDLHDRMRSWGGSDGGARTAQTGAQAQQRHIETGEEASLPVIEEEIRVGKREVDRGGVRVRAHVTETPVEETVNLRDEHVHVERRPADRPISDADRDLLRDQTFEVREHDEEAVVSKDARVVEEVVVRKDADVRQEKIQDSVRRTDVEVEQLGGQNIQDWDRFRDDFRTHYTSTFGSRGRDFSYYEPAYRYGYSIASRPEYRGRSWSQIEPEIRRDWESRNQGSTWDDIKDAVQHSWNRMTR